MTVVIPGLRVSVVAALVRGSLPTEIVSSVAPGVMSATVIRTSAMAAPATVTAGMSPRISGRWE